MSDDKGKTDDKGTADDKGSDEPYLGSWKTKDDAAEGLKNLQTKLSEQGNETSTLRKQIEEGQTFMTEMQTKLQTAEEANKANTSNRARNESASEQERIAQQIADLDPVDEGYSANLMSLMGKSNALAAKGQHTQTLTAATEAFKKELDERDIKSAHQSFYGANPEFNTPEMQARIKEQMAKDATGMSDSLSAFREIQRDDVTLKMQELTEQNTELTKRLELKGGTDATGTVLVKGQGDQSAQTQPKTTGADRDKGMADILAKMGG